MSMTTQIIDFSEIDLTGGLRFNGEAIGAAHINGERLWPFGVDLLYTGGIGGASYLPDPADVYGANTLAAFGGSVSAILDEKNGTPVLGPELVDTANTASAWVAYGTNTVAQDGDAVRVNFVDAAVGAYLYLTQAGGLSSNLVSGKSYQMQVQLRLNAGSANFSIFSTSLGNYIDDQSITGTNYVTRTYIFQYISGLPYIQFANLSAGESVWIRNISVREIPGILSRQLSTSLRPLLGRAPKEQRNRLIWTEDFANAAWSKNAITPAVTVDTPSPAIVAYDLIDTAVNNVHSLSQAFVFVAGVQYTISARVKYAGRHFQIVPGNTIVSGGYAAFDLQNGVVGNLVGTGMTSAIEALGDGWYLCSATFTSASTNTSSPALALVPSPTSARLPAYTGDGTSGIKLAGPQFEIGAEVTDYQRVGVATDTTETGVPSYPFVRFDLSDDRLDTVLPQAVTGDVVIAGRNGSVIAPHSYAANSTFQLGPTSYTGGTPGILRAIGDVVGWSILGKTLTAAERERLMRFYKRRGAKGLLVPGPELVVNGGFDTDLSGWSTSTFAWSDGAAVGIATNPTMSQTMPTAAGKAYEVKIDVSNLVGGTYFVRFVGGATVNGPSLGNGSHTLVMVGAGSSNLLIDRAGGSIASATIDNISVRELRPEEEW